MGYNIKSVTKRLPEKKTSTRCVPFSLIYVFFQICFSIENASPKCEPCACASKRLRAKGRKEDAFNTRAAGKRVCACTVNQEE